MPDARAGCWSTMIIWKEKTIETSLELDDQIRATEQKQFDMEYKMEYDDYIKRKKSYKNNKTRAYGLILERCTRAMAQKIQARKNFNALVHLSKIRPYALVLLFLYDFFLFI